MYLVNVPASFKVSRVVGCCDGTAVGKAAMSYPPWGQALLPCCICPSKILIPKGLKGVSFTVLWHVAKFLSRKTRIKKIVNHQTL